MIRAASLLQDPPKLLCDKRLHTHEHWNRAERDPEIGCASFRRQKLWATISSSNGKVVRISLSYGHA